MAEIKIEKRKKKPVWPWILALLIIGAVVIWIWTDDPETTMEDRGVTTEERAPDDERMDERERARDDGARDTEDAMAASGAVDEYVSYVQDNGGSMGKDHEYTKNGITRLADALEAMANRMPESPEVDQEVEKLKNQAERLTRERESPRHSNMIREAFISSANVLENFQERNYPEMDQEVEDLKESAERVKKDELATEQSDEVNQYFSQSANLIQQMSKDIQS